MAIIRKNEATAAKRRAKMYIYQADGVTAAPLATTFTTGGGGNTQIGNGTTYTDAAGTITNTGVDGEWVYEFTQAEVNVTANELSVKVVKATFQTRIITVDLLDPADVNDVNAKNWNGTAIAANLGANGGVPLVGTQIPNANAGANNGLPVQGGAIPNANAGAVNGLPVQGGAIPNANANSVNGLPIQGGAIPNANAAAVGGLATISAAGQGPGGVLKPNSMEDNCVYSAGKLTSSRLRVFASSGALASAVAGHANGTDGEVERYVSAATYNGDGTLASFSWTKQL